MENILTTLGITNYYFITILVVSRIAGMLSTMNIWANDIGDVRFHMNDFYMVILITSWITIIGYLLAQKTMQIPKSGFIFAIVTVILTMIAIRKQIFVSDNQYLNGLIPYNSMGILMAKKIKDKTKDERVKKLAENLIILKTNEIDYVKQLLREKK